MLVEFKDFVAVVEAPNNEERSLAVIAEVNKLVPNKKIRYLVNTHHHMDHAGGFGPISPKEPPSSHTDQ